MQKSAKATKKHPRFAGKTVFCFKKTGEGKENVGGGAFFEKKCPSSHTLSPKEALRKRKKQNGGRWSKDLRRCRKSEVCPARGTANAPPEHVASQHALSRYAGPGSPYRRVGTKKRRSPFGDLLFLVPVVGVEPTRYRYHWILSPARLPIPSHRREQGYYNIRKRKNQAFLEKSQKTFFVKFLLEEGAGGDIFFSKKSLLPPSFPLISLFQSRSVRSKW